MDEIRDLLSQGLEMEEEAHSFYTRASQKVLHPGARAMLLELAAEEARHIALFQAALAGKSVEFGILEPEPGQDLGLAERLKAPALQDTSDPGDILVLAMKREWAAIQRYQKWAEGHPGTVLAHLATRLASEERSHKYRLERLYDDEFLKGN